MWHSRLTPDEISAICKSAAYPLLTNLHAKLKLVVIDALITKSQDPSYLMGTENGLSVLRITLNNEGVWYAHTVDSPLCPVAEWHNVTLVARSKNTRYLTNVVSTEARNAGRKVLNSIESVMRTNIGNALTALAGDIKRKTSNEASIGSLGETDIFHALSVLVGDKTLTELPVNTLTSLQDWHKAYIDRANNRIAHTKALDTVFKNEKWLLCARKNIDPRLHSYFVCSLDTSKMTDAARKGFWSEGNVAESMTTPIQLYRNLSFLPDAFKDNLLGSLTMFKQYRQRNFTSMVTMDDYGYFPFGFLMDEDSGAVSWNYGGAHMLMLDK